MAQQVKRDPFDAWILADSRGREIITFQTFIAMNLNASGQVANVPMERGAFSIYNKIQHPTRISVMIGCQGEPNELQKAINTLIRLKREASTFSLVTPEQEYKNLTLESFSFSRKREEGTNVLYVSLEIVQICPMEPDVSDKSRTKPLELENVKKPDAADPKADVSKATKTGAQELEEKKTAAVKKKNLLTTVSDAVKKVQEVYNKGMNVYRKVNELKSSITNLANLPNQLKTMVINDVAIQIHTFQRGSALYADLSVDGVIKSAGQICKNGIDLVNGSIEGVKDSLSFIDAKGSLDPVFTGLEDRFQLVKTAVEDTVKEVTEK